MADPDAMEIDSNLIGGNMTCSGNSAGGVSTVQFGDGGAAPSTVGGSASGQCGFNVQVLNPATEAGPGGIPEHISVSAASLGTYSGTHTQSGPSVRNAPLGSDRIGRHHQRAAEQRHLRRFGPRRNPHGRTRRPFGSTGEAVRFTTTPTVQSRSPPSTTARPAPSRQAVVPLRSGPTGQSPPLADLTGTFLVTSGGAGDGDLSTLAGYGTFTSKVRPWHIGSRRAPEDHLITRRSREGPGLVPGD